MTYLPNNRIPKRLSRRAPIRTYRVRLLLVLLVGLLLAVPGQSGTLVGNEAASSGTVDLFSAGPGDWSHWGLAAVGDFNRKATGSSQISNYTQIGGTAPTQFTDGGVGFTWTGGTPTASATSSTTGIAVAGVGNGFRITVPASVTLRTLKLYVGGRGTNPLGTLTAVLSDGSATTYTTTKSSASPFYNVYTLDYAADAAGQTLTVSWVGNRAGGSVALQAAALSVRASTAPLAHWKFDEAAGTSATDSSNNGNTGTLNGGAGWAAGRINNGLSLDGATGYVDVGAAPLLNVTGEMTVTAWIKTGDASLDQSIVGKQDNVSGGYRLALGSGKVWLQVRNSANGVATVSGVAGGTSLVSNTWYHVVGVYSQTGGYVRCYVNGSQDRNSATGLILAPTAGNAAIGRLPWSASDRFNGMIDDVRVYNRVLSDGEIANLAAEQPLPPTDLIATAGNAQVTLRWSADSTATSYKVFRSTTSGVYGAAIASGVAGTSHTDNTATNNTVYYYTVQGTNANGDSARSNEAVGTPSATGLMAYWSFNENTGTTAADTSGFNNTGTLTGSPSWAPGRAGASVRLNGTSQYVSAGSGVNLKITGEVTVAAWVKLESTGDGRIAGKQDNVGGGYKLMSGDQFNFQIRDSNNLNYEIGGSGTSLATSQWYHVAGVYSDNGNFIRSYVNGTLDRENTSFTRMLALAGGPFIIGRQPYSASGYVDGSIDELRVYNRALTQPEVAALYNIPPNNPTDLTATAGNAQVTLRWSAATGATSYKVFRSTTSGVYGAAIASGVAGTSHTDNTATNNTVYYYTVQGTNGAGDSARSNEAVGTPSATGLMAHWRFDENTGTSTADASGFNNTATLIGTPTPPSWTSGRNGYGISFDGANDYVNGGSGASLNITGDVTVAAWVRTLDTGIVQILGGKGDNVSGGYKLILHSNNKISLQIRNSANTSYDVSGVAGGTVLAINTWYHVLGIYSQGGNTVRTYVNGVLDRTGVPTVQLAPTGGNLTLGRQTFQSNNYFHGQMDDVRVYNRVLSATEIETLAGSPANLVATTGPTQVGLSWTAYASATGGTVSGYNLYRATSNNGQVGAPLQTLAAPATSFNDTTAAAGQLYYYKVTAIVDGTETAQSNQAISGITSGAAIDYSTGFAPSPNLNKNGSAALSNARLRLTSNVNNQAGSAFHNQLVNVSRFHTQFLFHLSSATADGITFTLQANTPASLGGSAGALGYENIPKSVAVKWDLYNNPANAQYSATGLYTNGADPQPVGTDLAPPGIDLHSGRVFNVGMDYDGTTLTVITTDMETGASATQTYAINIPGTIGTNVAFAGFTGATGGSTATQEILQWRLTGDATGMPPSYQISGTVFDDVNFGGTGRPYAAANTAAQTSGWADGAILRSNVRAELYDGAGNFLSPATTTAGGLFTVHAVPVGTYTLRLVNSGVSSPRAGWASTLRPVQTFRTDGAGAGVLNEVGGAYPNSIDANNGSTTLAALTNTGVTPNVRPQSLTPVSVTNAHVTGIDFGFNFSTVVNTNDTGQGSLRQFLTNANTLGNKVAALPATPGLAQSGQRKNGSNADEPLPADKETSIFVIPSAQLTGGVAVIAPATALPTITGVNAPHMVLDGTTQTVNVGNTNNATLGAGGAGQTFDKVGVGADGVAGTGDDYDLATLNGPEVEIKDGATLTIGLNIQASYVTVRGVGIHGFGSNNDDGNLLILGGYDYTRIEGCVIGSGATAFVNPAALPNGGGNIVGRASVGTGPDFGTIQNNLIGFSGDGSGVRMDNDATNWTIENNEIRDNNRSNFIRDGVALRQGSTNIVRGNLIVGTKSMGVDTFQSTGANTIENNTITGNGVGAGTSEQHGIRLEGNNNQVRFNRIHANYGAGVLVSSASTGNTLTKNSVYANGTITNDASAAATGAVGIDLLGTSGVTINDSGDSDAGGNNLLNFPVLQSAVLAGTNLEVTGYAGPGATIELFVAEATPDPTGFGEGQTFLVTLTEGAGAGIVDNDATTNAPYVSPVAGRTVGTDTTSRFRFTIPLASLPGVAAGTVLTTTATLGGNTSEFGNNVSVASALSIAGTLFEDVNYGGGAGRPYATANTSATASTWTSGAIRLGSARVELYDGSGNFFASALTNASGQYSFANLAPGTWQVNVPYGGTPSVRAGYNPAASPPVTPVQTFRTDAAGGSVVAVTDRVGGEDPTKGGVNPNTTSAQLSSLTDVDNTPQAITNVALSAANLTGVDFGFNFNAITRATGTGSGTLAQFLVNSNALGSESLLAQQNQTAGKDAAIFMIPNGTARPGLRAGLTNQLNGSGVAVINVTAALPVVTGANTVLDGTTQTANVGDTNAGALGAGGTVGVGADGIDATGDEPTLSQVNRPEVQIVGTNAVTVGIDITANNTTIRGIAVYGFGRNNDTSVTDANIRIANNVTGALIEQNVIGTSATSFSDPGVGVRTGNHNICSNGGDTGTIQNNLVGFGGFGAGVRVQNTSTGWIVQNNEMRGNGILHAARDGLTFEDGSASCQAIGNLLINNKGCGLDTLNATGTNTVRNNTVTGNGKGTIIPGGATIETPGVRLMGANSLVEWNKIHGNYGAGVLVVNNAGTGNNKISQNSIYANGTVTNDTGTAATGQIGIDLIRTGENNLGASPFVSFNDSGDTDTGGNGVRNAPVLTSATLSGGNLTLTGYTRTGAAVELFLADSPVDPTGFGEGKTYLVSVVENSAAGVVDTDNGTGPYSFTYNVLGANYTSQDDSTCKRFRFTLPTPAGVAAGSVLTSTTTNGTETSEFGRNVTVTAALSIAGTLFEDPNYGGGAGRDYTAANTAATASGFANNAVQRPGARVELYDSAGNFATSATTSASGLYTFDSLAPDTWKVRVVNSTVTSTRTVVAGLVPVQTFRTDYSSGSRSVVVDRVGGEKPDKADAAANTTNLRYTSVDTVGTPVQSVTTVLLSASSPGDVDFGFNFSTIVNKNDTGQGSLRQFLTNSNALANTNLHQAGQIAGDEATIFLIYDGQSPAPAGLNTGMANQLTGGVAVIALQTALPTITGANTRIDGTTQTSNVGNTNAALLGAGGAGQTHDKVGVGPDGRAGTADDRDLTQVAGPEIQIQEAAAVTIANGLNVDANNVAVKGLAVYGFGIDIRSTSARTGLLVESCLLGSGATSFADPGAAVRSTVCLDANGADNGVARGNLIGFAGGGGVNLPGATGWLVENNEIRSCSLGSTTAEGIYLGNAGTASDTIRGNLLIDNRGNAIEMFNATGSHVIEENTIVDSGRNSTASQYTIFVYGTNNTIRYNIIANNYRAGITVHSSSTGNTISKNAIYNNGTITDINGNPATGALGIDLQGSNGVTINDAGDADTGGNNLVNFPILDNATYSSATGNLTVTGYAAAGAIIELFVADSTQAGFGEGQTFLKKLVEGDATGASGDAADIDNTANSTYGPANINGLSQGTDTTNKFSFTFTLPAGVSASTVLTATLTLSGNTSEFSGNVTVISSDPDLTITKTHAGNFVRNTTATYTLTVSNNSSAGIAGGAVITVTDTLPAGLSYNNASGTGWGAPGVSGQMLTWTRSDGLGASASYPAITVTVNVLASAPASLTNTADVALAGETNTANNSASDPTIVATPQLLLVKRITALNGVDITGFTDDPADVNDNHAFWPTPLSTYLRGAVSQSQVLPGALVEYTVYFLSTGTAAAAQVELCDVLPEQTRFVDTSYTGQSPADPGGLAGVALGIALGWDGAAVPSTPTAYLSNVEDGDRGRFYPAGTQAPPAANAPGFAAPLPAVSNLAGVIGVRLVSGAFTVPFATASGVPADSYGFIRFQVRIR